MSLEKVTMKSDVGLKKFICILLKYSSYFQFFLCKNSLKFILEFKWKVKWQITFYNKLSGNQSHILDDLTSLLLCVFLFFKETMRNGLCNFGGLIYLLKN